jgi:hypothetical protein
VSGPEDLQAGYDWASYRASRDRYLAQVRPEAMDDPPPVACADTIPIGWIVVGREDATRDEPGRGADG